MKKSKKPRKLKLKRETIRQENRVRGGDDIVTFIETECQDTVWCPTIGCGV